MNRSYLFDGLVGFQGAPGGPPRGCAHPFWSIIVVMVRAIFWVRTHVQKSVSLAKYSKTTKKVQLVEVTLLTISLFFGTFLVNCFCTLGWCVFVCSRGSRR